MKTFKLKISGMSCQHCVMNLSKMLKKIENIEIQQIQINEALITLENIEDKKDEIKKMVEKAGYQLVEINEI